MSGKELDSLNSLKKSGSLDSQARIAEQVFNLENNVEELDADDLIYQYDADSQRAILNEAPWRKDPSYFRCARISTIALLKMAMHARSGGSIEIMGIMTGKIIENEFIVMDTFPLPVEGTETRVNALGEAYEFMVQNLTSNQEVGRKENVIGWYHSHPGYGCWLSGIDVGTQLQNQTFQDPFLAVVIDPDRTIAAGKVDIGAFRTYPEKMNTAEVRDQSLTVPAGKLEDFGVHANKYYPLEIKYFKSSLDKKLLELLWNRYWGSTLSHSSLLVNQQFVTNQIEDLSIKTERVCRSGVTFAEMFKKLKATKPTKSSRSQKAAASSGAPTNVLPLETFKDITKVTSEELYGLTSKVLRNRVLSPNLED